MSSVPGRWASIAILGLLAQPSFADPSNDSYWSRPVLKARTSTGGYVLGEIWDDGLGVYVPFSDYENDDTTLVTIAPNTSPTAAYQAQAYAAAGDEGTYGEITSNGSLSFNVPGQAVAEASLLGEMNLEVKARDGDWAAVEFGHGFVMEAKHKLCSDTLPNGTWKGVNLKCLVAYVCSGSASFFFGCDWVIAGYPGTPTITGDNYGISITYWDPETEQSVQLYDEDGTIYVDIPGWLQIGNEVTWISSYGSGNPNFAPWGYSYHYGYLPKYMAGYMAQALLELEVFDAP